MIVIFGTHRGGKFLYHLRLQVWQIPQNQVRESMGIGLGGKLNNRSQVHLVVCGFAEMAYVVSTRMQLPVSTQTSFEDFFLQLPAIYKYVLDDVVAFNT